MTNPTSGGAPDPYQPQQPYGAPSDPTAPYSSTPASGQPYAQPATNEQPNYGAQPGDYAQQPGDYAQQPAVYAQPAYGQPAYGQNPYGAGPYGGAYPAGPSTNVLAIISLCCSIGGLFTCITAPVGIVLGHIARRQIRQTGEQGAGLALAGLWVGYILTGLGVAFVLGWLILIGFAVSQDNTTS